MFNLKIIFRFFSLVFIAGIFFGFSNVLGICTIGPDGSYNGGSMLKPSNSQIPGGCRSYTTDQSSINRYKNNQSLSDNAKKFIVAYELGASFDLGCDSTYVSTIQYQMQIVGGSCSTCDDGRFGRDTKNKLDNNCLPTCTSPKQPVNADLQNPCNMDYILDNGCCISNCPAPKTLPTNGSCSTANGLTGDGAGCCILISSNTGTNNTGSNNTGSNNTGTGGGNGTTGGTTTGNNNTCTATGQIGVLSGTSRDCTSCPSLTTPNADHTKCICDPTKKCCGIKLNTVVPFIGDCIEMSNDESAGNTTRVNALNAFPILMGSLSKMLVTAILIFSFVMVVIGGVLIIAGGIDPGNAKKGKDIIFKVIVGLALLGASGIILRLINPNFFG